MVLIKANSVKFKWFVILVFFIQIGNAQRNEKPKLVVGIIVDQMRAEYLYRFQDNYSENGFKRLIREGFTVKNMHYNYIPTATGPGHASVYTGTTPAGHGIVANDWYSRTKKGTTYCAEDGTVNLVDGTGVTLGEQNRYSRSPKNLVASTITDELKLFSNGRSKVIGISLKDRGAIFPAGHLADHAFWYHNETGKFISSSYYSDQLPDWLIQFNHRNLADSLLNLTWDTLKPMKDYKNSGPDMACMEKLFAGKKRATFPYRLKQLRGKNGNLAMIPFVPFGNTLLTQLAKTTIKEADLGQGEETDFLAISYSSTDYIGHGFGIRSKELEDTYLRMDLEISELLSFLDAEVGVGQYVLFLTADHAASDHPDFLMTSKLPGSYFQVALIQQALNTKLSALFGKDGYVSYMDKTQIYLNQAKTPKMELLNAAVSILDSVPGIQTLYVPQLHADRNHKMDTFFRNSFQIDNSGDILLHFKSGWMPKRTEGTTHGALYNNDTHVPSLWFGWGISKGETVKRKTIDQIAPTLSLLLGIPFPSNSSNQPIDELFR